jgi:proteasome activator subunit 4
MEQVTSDWYISFSLFTGIIRGAKHWPFHKVSALWKSLTPIIRLALLNMTVETVADWGICFATSSVSSEVIPTLPL